MRTDGRTDTTKIKVVFRNFVKAPKKKENPKTQNDVMDQTSDFQSHDNPRLFQ